MARVIWSPRAIFDLEGICTHIEKDSDRYARRVAQRVFATVERLAVMPESGSLVPEYEQFALRECFVHHYRIIYQCAEDALNVVLVQHAARTLPPASELNLPQ